MSKISKKTSIVMPSVTQDKAITAAAKSDPDAQPLTPTQGHGSSKDTSRSSKVRENKTIGLHTLQP
jgi:hypothetical protein